MLLTNNDRSRSRVDRKCDLSEGAVMIIYRKRGTYIIYLYIFNYSSHLASVYTDVTPLGHQRQHLYSMA